jgi:hypothetical protein
MNPTPRMNHASQSRERFWSESPNYRQWLGKSFPINAVEVEIRRQNASGRDENGFAVLARWHAVATEL